MKILLIFTMSIMICLNFYGCKDWEYDVERNGIHFKKVSQSKNGTNICYMSDNHNIQGFPCEKGWIHFDKNWQLLSFQLSTEFTYNKTLLPTHTWLHFSNPDTSAGYVCSFPYDYEVQGYLCRGSGGYKGTQTGFYNNGNLKSFFPSEDLIIKGVSCKASLLFNVNLHRV